jgi:hypothetical protein
MITFEIHGLPKMANGGHGHWRADYAHKQMWRKMVGIALYGQVPKVPFEKAKATFTRCSSSEPDDDGLVHGFKATRDALKHFGVIVDDRPSCLKSEYKWERAKRGAGKIKVSVEQL